MFALSHGVRSCAPLLAIACILAAPRLVLASDADDAQPVRQALEDAWWTGPILAPSAATLPQGHVLIEPYLYDSISYAAYDGTGERHDTADTHFLGSQTYVLYGLVDTLSVGVIPRFGYRDSSAGPDSSGIRVGDLSLLAQYRLPQLPSFRRKSEPPSTSSASPPPTMSIVLQATLPTGKHDQLGTHPSDGMGSGAYSLMAGIYMQHFFWMPNGRIVRARFNVTNTFVDEAELRDVSVYGTPEGFRGRAKPGDSFLAIAAAEYSVTRNWVLAMDVQYQRDERTPVSGSVPRIDGSRAAAGYMLPARRAISIAPAVEYNFNSTIGVICGAIWTATGRNADANLIPVVALNMVF